MGQKLESEDTWGHQQLEEARDKFSLEPVEGARPWQPLDLVLSDSRKVRKEISVIFSHPACWWHPQETNAHAFQQALKSLHGQDNRNIIAFTEYLMCQKVSTCIKSFIPHNYPRSCHSNTCSENEGNMSQGVEELVQVIKLAGGRVQTATQMVWCQSLLV